MAGYYVVRHLVQICTVIFALALLAAVPVPNDDQRAVDAMNPILARFDKLQSFSAKYHEEQTELGAAMVAMLGARPGAQANLPTTMPDATRSWDKEFHFLNGLVKTHYDLTNEMPPAPNIGEVVEETMVLTPDHYEQLVFRPGPRPNSGLGAIGKENGIPETIDQALGLREFESRKWITRDQLAKFKVTFPNDNDVVLTSSDAKLGVEQWTFSRKLDYAVTKWLVGRDEDNGIVTTCEDFRQVGGIMLPFKLTQEVANTATGQRLVTQRTVITVQQYTVGSTDNVPANYHIDWPAGVRVFDFRGGGRGVRVFPQAPAPNGQNSSGGTTRPSR